MAVVGKITKRRCGQIKWWWLQGPCKEEFQKAIVSKWESKDFEGNSNKIWEKIAEMLMEAAVVVLGKTKGGKSIQKETAWWNDAMKQQVKDKKTKFKKWQRTRDAADQHEYQEAKKMTKRMGQRQRPKHIRISTKSWIAKREKRWSTGWQRLERGQQEMWHR